MILPVTMEFALPEYTVNSLVDMLFMLTRSEHLSSPDTTQVGRQERLGTVRLNVKQDTCKFCKEKMSSRD